MYSFILDILFVSISSIAVVPNKNHPELNAIFESNAVNFTILNGLNLYIKNKLIYIFITD